MTARTCADCGLVLARRPGVGRPRLRCPDCWLVARREQMQRARRASYLKHRDERLARQSAYYDAHRSARLAYQRAYHAAKGAQSQHA